MREKMLKIADCLMKRSKDVMGPISHLSIDEQVRTPNYPIAFALDEVSQAIKRELET